MSRNHPKPPRRRNIRLPGYNYARPGWYFVTICVQNMKYFIFGDVIDEKMVLSDAGRIVLHEWYLTSHLRNNVDLDEFVVMPNHIHGIVIIREKYHFGRGKRMFSGSVLQYAPTTENEIQCDVENDYDVNDIQHTTENEMQFNVNEHNSNEMHRPMKNEKKQNVKLPCKSPSQTLGAIIRGFKSATTKQININRNAPGKQIWQRNYHEEIIKNESHLYNVRKYIRNNPPVWYRDRNSPPTK